MSSGAQKDGDNLRSVFQGGFINNFAIRMEEDLNKTRLLQVLTDVKGEIERGGFKSFFCIVSSHGESHTVKAADGKTGYRVCLYFI